MTWSIICDIYLCKDCYDFRIRPAPLSDNVSDNASLAKSSLVFMVSDVFAARKTNAALWLLVNLLNSVRTFMIKTKCVCRSLTEQYVPHRCQCAKGEIYAFRSSIEDMFEFCASPKIKLPSFYALPPVDASHGDLSAIRKAVTGAEFNNTTVSADLHEEMDNLETMIVRQGDECCDMYAT